MSTGEGCRSRRVRMKGKGRMRTEGVGVKDIE